MLSIRLAAHALLAHPLRTALTVSAVALGAATTVAGDVISGAIVNALTQSDDVRAIAGGLFGQIEPILAGIGAAITLAAGFLVFNTLGMALTQRRQQLGLLRVLGLTRGQLLRLALTEAGLIGAAGVTLGLATGPLLGRGVVAVLQRVDTPILGAFLERGARPAAFVLAAALGLGLTTLAGLMPAWQAARVSPLVALAAPEPAGRPRPAIRPARLGLALMAALGLWAALAPPARWVQYPADLALTLLFAAAWLGALVLALPAAVEALGAGLRPGLARLWGAGGRLLADNLQRGRTRLALSVTTLAVGLGLIVTTAGFFQFYLAELFGPALRAARNSGGWILTTFDVEAGVSAYAGLASLRLPGQVAAEARALAGERGLVTESYFVIVPELSYFYEDYFSFVLDPHIIAQGGDFYFKFSQGSLETALPVLDQGCGLLVAPGVARRNGAGLGQVITVTGRAGPVRCTVAGIGQPYVGASIIGRGAREQFVLGDPFALFVRPQGEGDPAALETDLRALAAARGLYLTRLTTMTDMIFEVFDVIPALFNGLLLLAVLAAALGVANTTLLSVTERRRELGQFRALGATRGQVRALVLGEAVVVGVVGGLLGLAAGAGLVVIFATVYGGNSLGVAGYAPWPAAWRSLAPALRTGLAGLLAAPVVCAVAAYAPAAGLLGGSALETLREA
jgi:putative ABC transport system permease protein